MNRWSALALLLAIVGALFLRAPQLGLRPLHNDEGVNAVKLAALWERGEYQYNPHEYHGPTLHYFSLPFLWLGSAKNSAELSDAQLRVITVSFGLGLILLLVLLGDGLGRTATLWTAIFIAVSPAMVFYSRYFIHEMLLVFFTMFTLTTGWRYVQSRKAVWAALTGAGVGLMFATKETFVLSIAAMCFALVATRLWNRWRSGATPPTGARNWRNRLAGAVHLLLHQRRWPTRFLQNLSAVVEPRRRRIPAHPSLVFLF